MNLRVEVYRDARGEWRWRRFADNGNIIAESGEGYHNRSDAAAMAEKQFPGDNIAIITPATLAWDTSSVDESKLSDE